MTNRLVVLTGPSCVGKSPLERALGRHHPERRRALRPLVLFTSREPRPGETDGVHYHFRRRTEIEALSSSTRHVVIDVRGDLQALALDELEATLARSDALFEGNPFVGRTLYTHPALADTPRISLFLSPLSRDELLFLRDPARHVALPELVTDVMRRKLLRRTRKQKGELSLGDLQTVERRAASAYRELRLAHHFDHVLPNHDGEDSDHWEAFPYPLGEARRALETLVALLEGRIVPWLERWEPDLLPEESTQ